MQVLSLLVPLTKENMMVNNSQRLSSMDTKIEDINVKIVKNEGKIVKNTDSISDVKSIVEGHSAEISSLSEAEERQEKRTTAQQQELYKGREGKGRKSTVKLGSGPR